MVERKTTQTWRSSSSVPAWEAANHKTNVVEVLQLRRADTEADGQATGSHEKMLAGTIIGLQGTRYTGTRRKDWRQRPMPFYSWSTSGKDAASHYGVVNARLLPTCNVAVRLDLLCDLAGQIAGARPRRRCNMRDGPYDWTVIAGHAPQRCTSLAKKFGETRKNVDT